MDNVGFDEQILVEKVGWQSIVGVYAAYAASGQENDLRAMRSHPTLDFGLAAKIQRSSARIKQQVTRFASKPPHDSAPDHAVLTSDPDKLIGQFE
jgi:hypothetical protein